MRRPREAADRETVWLIVLGVALARERAADGANAARTAMGHSR